MFFNREYLNGYLIDFKSTLNRELCNDSIPGKRDTRSIASDFLYSGIPEIIGNEITMVL